MEIQMSGNYCVVCGKPIPEGKQTCFQCDQTFSTTEPAVNEDKITTAYRQGYTKGFEVGTRSMCAIKQENERLKRENALLHCQLEQRVRIDDVDAEYE